MCQSRIWLCLSCILLWLIPVAGLAHPKRTFVYKAISNCLLQADVYGPMDDQARPAILWIHGGALILGHRGNINPQQLDRYVSAGFVVVSIDYRLAPEAKLPSILEDIQDAYRWLREKGPDLFHIDPNRIAVLGHSAGGYLTLTCGYRLQPRPRALVSFYGYGDIIAPWYSRPDPFYLREPAVSREKAYQAVGHVILCECQSEEQGQRGAFYLYCRQQGLWPKEVVGIDPNTDPEAFNPFCPARNVSKGYPPTLLLHGDNDTDVPFEQSEQMARELRLHGIEHELIRIPRGEHGFDGRMTSPDISAVFQQVINFLKEHLQ